MSALDEARDAFHAAREARAAALAELEAKKAAHLAAMAAAEAAEKERFQATMSHAQANDECAQAWDNYMRLLNG